jgi:hypothetical protein
MTRTVEMRKALNKLGYTLELVCVQEEEDYYFHGKSQITDLDSDFNALCRKANELNKLRNSWGIYYYVRKLS